MIQIKRAYDPPSPDDGKRFLVERLWPRGVTKQALAADAWLKDVAPSTELRQWFGHQVERWDEFRRRYRRELDAHPEAWAALLGESEHGLVTLVFGARDPLHNSAIVLRDYLAERQRRVRQARGRTRAAAHRHHS